MSFIELLLIAIGLSMDAFAVATTSGMTKKNINLRWTIAIAGVFGVFQGIMPTMGYLLGNTLTGYIEKYDHIIAFILLGFIGFNMLFEAVKEDGRKDTSEQRKNITWGAILIEGVATSIDALAVGVSFSALRVDIISSALFIATVTFFISICGVLIGKKFGSLLQKKAEIIGGLILIGIGIKIFLEQTIFG